MATLKSVIQLPTILTMLCDTFYFKELGKEQDNSVIVVMCHTMPKLGILVAGPTQ